MTQPDLEIGNKKFIGISVDLTRPSSGHKYEHFGAIDLLPLLGLASPREHHGVFFGGSPLKGAARSIPQFFTLGNISRSHRSVIAVAGGQNATNVPGLPVDSAFLTP
ncbi:hypothetical protein [Pseudomonas guariconensis]|uniref:hypothetical protein n=1 Tax=Pseudomonas guariconensis TaxID=1288410 RepID=UPI0018D61E69|nr:hypothetical protein [Pseudomonas guariconensis]MBH3359089.1 hypothetical protein [Pseudomonas guariconensis]